MNTNKLVRMANEIAAFFRSYPEDQACASIRDHIMTFWTPGMRSALLAEPRTASLGLDPLVAVALRALPEPESPIARKLASEKAVGHLASDAN